MQQDHDRDREEPRISGLDRDELQTEYGPGAGAEGKRSPATLIFGAIVLVVVLAVAYFFTMGGDRSAPAPEPPLVVKPASEPVAIPAQTPDIPTVVAPAATEPEPDIAETAPARPPVTLETSDEPVREELARAGSSDLYSSLVANEDLIRRSTGVIDGMSRGLVLQKILPLPRPAGAFTALELEGQVVVDPASYERYDSYAQAIAGVDTAQLATVFHQFRPLLEQAYAELGYPPADFDNALIRALDQIIATPEISDTIPLKKKEAMYLYVDPALEGLAPLQKQLLRMGPDNIATIKAQAKALRADLLGQ